MSNSERGNPSTWCAAAASNFDGCFAATGDRPGALSDRHWLVAELESGHRHLNSTGTGHSSLVIDEFAAANSTPTRLDRFFGYCGRKKPPLGLEWEEHVSLPWHARM
ncbi:MAG: hypothetical protein ACJAUC_004279 [Planctomycetota bacterium]|jgi:hypothetical protein